MRLYIVGILCLCVLWSKGQPCYFAQNIGTTEVEISNSAVELGDGTIYVTGSQGNGPLGNNDIALLKFDACGNLLWTKFLGDSLANDAIYLNTTSDGKLLVAGQSATPSNGSDGVFYLLDSSGNVLLQKLYGDSLDQSFRYVERTMDKGYLMGGYTSDPFGSNDSYVVKVDSLGQIQWQQIFGGPGPEYVDQVKELPDSNFIVSSDTKSFGNGGTDVEVTKLRKDGSVIWDKFYGDNLENGCQGIYLLSNGNYLSYGETNVTGSVAFDFFIQQLDTAGNSISRHTFGGTAADALFDLYELPGMDFMCTGYSRSFNGFQAYDMVLFRIDSAGNMKWLKNILSPGLDIGYKLIPSLYGDYIMTGLFDFNNTNYFLTRSDTIPNTNVGIGSIAMDASFTVFPNPAVDEVLIHTGEAGITKAELLTAEGQKVKEIQVEGNFTLSTREIPSGVYTLLLSGKNRETIAKKLVINK